MRHRRLLGLSAAFAALTAAVPALAQQFPYLGEVVLVALPFCPREYVEADGRSLSLPRNIALFALYGTRFGGDGVHDFNVPDLRGRIPMGAGAGPGGTFKTGDMVGSPGVVLDPSQLPPHTHQLMATSKNRDTGSPTNASLAPYPVASEVYSSTGSADKSMRPGVIAPNGSNDPVSVQQPTATLRYCIATLGIFPIRH